MRCFLLLVLLIVACDRSTAPRSFTLGPGCWWERPIHDVVLRVHYPDCSQFNLDSLRADGWRVIPDTVWH